MRVSKEKAVENRARIVAAASRLFRENGFEATGVDAVMQQVGLTHGGFYRYFRSKEDLAAEALAHGLAGSVQQAPPPSLDAFVANYLSAPHRADPGGGCMVAACGAEIARQGPLARHLMTEHLDRSLDRIGAMVGAGREDARARAIATFAGIVGAMVLARAVDDTALSDEILAAARAAFGAPPAGGVPPVGGVTPPGGSATQTP